MMRRNPLVNWKENGWRKPGRKKDFARGLIQRRFGLTDIQMKRVPVAQIVRTADAAAVRLLLGISR